MDAVHFHLMVLHFPIALLIVGAILEIWALASGRPGVRGAARIVLVVGGLGAVATAFSGQAAEEIVEEALPLSEAMLEEHEEIGMLAAYLAGALVLLELVTLRLRSSAVQWGGAIFAVIVAVVVGVAGFTGGKIRHEPLAGGGAATAPSLPAASEHEDD